VVYSWHCIHAVSRKSWLW